MKHLLARRKVRRALHIMVAVALAATTCVALNVAGTQPARASATSGYVAGLLKGEFVDACSYASPSDWNQYWTQTSHMYGIGFYLGGTTAAGAGCLTPSGVSRRSWVIGITAKSTLLPIYDGVQAPCYSGGANTMSSTPSTAQSQGQSSAGTATSNLNDDYLGQNQDIAYFDMEAFSPASSSCQTAVESFVNGWVQGMHGSGSTPTNLAGLYGSASASYMQNYSGISNPPDDVWLADYSSGDTASTSSESSYIRTADWDNDQRLHQWESPGTEQVGGSSIPLDYDCADGQQAYFYSQSAYNGACATPGS